MNIVHIERRSEQDDMGTRWGDRAARRRDILRAGRELIRKRGLAGLQMREVAAKAGIGLGTVYTYFPTKEALFAAMYAERLDQMLVELEPLLADTADVEQLFVDIATSYRDVYAEFGKELDLLSLLAQRADLDPSVAGQLIVSAGRLLAAMQRVVAETGVPDPANALILLWSTVTGLADHFTGPRHQLHSQTWDDAVRFAARTLARGLVPERHKL